MILSAFGCFAGLETPRAVARNYMASLVRFCAVPYVRPYGDLVLSDLISAFANLDKTADEIASAEFERLSLEPAGEDRDADMSALAEAAQEKLLAFYDTMLSLHQTALNHFAAGLFHVVEQHLANLCPGGAFAMSGISGRRTINLTPIRRDVVKRSDLQGQLSACIGEGHRSEENRH